MVTDKAELLKSCIEYLKIAHRHMVDVADAWGVRGRSDLSKEYLRQARECDLLIKWVKEAVEKDEAKVQGDGV